MCLYTNIQKHEVNNIFIYENKKWILCCMNTIHEIHKIYQYYKKIKYTSCALFIHQQILGERNSMMVPHISFKQQNHFQLW